MPARRLPAGSGGKPSASSTRPWIFATTTWRPCACAASCARILTTTCPPPAPTTRLPCWRAWAPAPPYPPPKRPPCSTGWGAARPACTSLPKPSAASPAPLALDTTLAEAYLARGENRLLDLRRTAPALADLRRGAGQLIRAGQPVPLPYLQAEGAALTHLARYPEARAVYLQALESQPEDGRTLFLLGRLAQQTGDSTSGCEFFRRGAKVGYDYATRAAEQCQ